MKKLTAILLTLSLMLTMLCTPALAEQSNTFLEETAILGAFGMSADEWIGTAEARVALAACMPLDLYFSFGEDSEVYRTVVASMDNGSVFVARDERVLHIVCFNGARQAIVLYFPDTDKLGYSMQEVSASMNPDSLMQHYVANGIISEYHAVPGEDILDFLQNLQ